MKYLHCFTIMSILFCAECRAQKTVLKDIISHESEKSIVYAPKYKFGDENLKKEFITSFQNGRYNLDYFNYGDNPDRTLITIELTIGRQGGLIDDFIIAEPEEIERLRPTLDRIFERIRDSWIPAVRINKENNEKKDAEWMLYVDLFFKDQVIDSVGLRY